MEVASPLPFAPTQAGAKRPFSCSPGHSPLHGMETTTDDFDYSHQSFKRRRFNSSENMDPSSSSFGAHSHTSGFSSTTTTQSRSPFHHGTGVSLKRTRSDLNDAPSWSHGEPQTVMNDLKSVVETQAAEIDSLKADKASLECSMNEVRSAHDKAVNENKILKKAVAILQERQNQAATEIEAASRFKVDAEDKVKRLEQMCLTLQYHLQAQHANSPGNDFLGYPPRPPDVY